MIVKIKIADDEPLETQQNSKSQRGYNGAILFFFFECAVTKY